MLTNKDENQECCNRQNQLTHSPVHHENQECLNRQKLNSCIRIEYGTLGKGHKER